MVPLRSFLGRVSRANLNFSFSFRTHPSILPSSRNYLKLNEVCTRRKKTFHPCFSCNDTTKLSIRDLNKTENVACKSSFHGVDAVKNSGSAESVWDSSDDCSILSVQIECPGDQADALVESLMSFGALSCSVEDANLGKDNEEEIFESGPIPWSESRRLWNESRITALYSVDEDVLESVKLAATSAGLTFLPNFKVTPVKNNDWVDQFQQMFNPLCICEGLWIIPHWCEPVDPRAVNVRLDPGLAFGTGDHPTTRLCLKFLLQQINGGEVVMDYGCGSGILSVTALKLGASRAVGVDIDPLAITSSSFNASLNHFDSSLFQVFVSSKKEAMDGEGEGEGNKKKKKKEGMYGDPVPKGLFMHLEREDMGEYANKEGGGEYDVVVANILVNPLIELSERILSYSKIGGRIALSGIIHSQVDQVIKVYEKNLKIIQVTEEDGWSCIQGIRKE